MMSRRYVLDGAVRRSGDGLVLAGGAPARLVRLTPAGRDVLDSALAGTPPRTPAGRALVRRLLDIGLIHPAGARPASVPITTIVPVRNGAPRLGALVQALLPAGRVIVVDDGSTDGSAEIAAAAGAEVVANAQLVGPAGARNTGLAAAATDLVAFVDDDCVVGPNWLDHLVGLFEDSELALAAPRVCSVPGTSLLARYETHCSPLDLGPHPSVVGPRRRLTFVPSAALVGRRTALLAVGGFDPQLRVGEDVDLVWRLAAAGWRVRYAPESRVQHQPRATLRRMARQRFDYGTSAPLLQRRHPGAATPLHAARHDVAIWAAGAAFGAPAASLVLAASAISAAVARESDRVARCHVATLVARGHLHATRHLARVAVREWLPVVAIAAIGSRRVRKLALAAVTVDTVAAGAHPGLRIVDNAAYAAGLWRGAVAARSVSALLVRPIPARRAHDGP